MMLNEGDRGLRGLDLRRLFYHHHVILDMTRDDLVHAHGRAETERQTDDQTERHLARNLDPTVESVFILAESLDIIVREAQRTHKKGRHEHQDHIDVRQFTEQQTGQQNGGNNDQTAHRRHSFLRYIEGIGFLVALRLRYIMPLHVIDEPIPEPDTYQQTDDACRDGAERDVGEQSRAGQMAVRRGQIVKKMIKHIL